MFSASRETIRRDLTVLAEAGRIQKVHGGAKVPQLGGEGPFKERMAENAPAKRSIARRAARFVAAGDTLFVDTGSTTLTYAEEIARTDDLTVITNSCEIAKTIGAQNETAQVYLVGGNFDADNRETYGAMAIAQLRHFHANHAVISIGGVDARAGLTDYNSDEAQVARTMVELSDNVIVLADSTKFNRVGSFAVCELSEVNYMVCESRPDAALVRALAGADVNVVC